MRRDRLPRGPLWITALVLVALTACGDRDDDAASTTSASSSTSSTSTTRSMTTTTTAPAVTTREPALPAPGRVLAYPGGGSGEVELEWSAVHGATGYRVVRAEMSAGPFATAATIDVEDGETTAAPGVVNVWSDTHSYFPGGGALPGPDGSDVFRLVDTTPGIHCFEVIALRDGAAGTPSAAACAYPP